MYAQVAVAVWREQQQCGVVAHIPVEQV